MAALPPPQTIHVSAPPTLEETAQIFLQWMFGTTGVLSDFNIGSIIRTFGESIGSVDEIQGITSQAQAFQALVYSAYNAFGITPIPAFNSTGLLTYSTPSGNPLPSGISIFIPVGSIAQTNGGVQFQTTSPATLASGQVSINTTIQSLLTGAITNVSSGSITQSLTSFPYPLVVYNNSPTSGGADSETPSQTLARLLAYVDSLGLCFPIAIASALMNMPPINNEYIRYSTVFEPWILAIQEMLPATAGFICYIDNGGGTASTALVNSAYTYLSTGIINNIPMGFDINGNVITKGISIGFRPAGVPYNVLAVTPLYCNVGVEVTAVNVNNASAVQSSILQAISTYFASLGFAATAELSQLTTSIGNVTFGQISSLAVTLENPLVIPPAVTIITAAYNERIIVQNVSVIVS